MLKVRLSKREIDVALLIAEGLTNKEIALTIGISQRRVNAIIFNIKGKLGISSRVEIGIITFQSQDVLKKQLEEITNA
jgi:two-component system, NarL family, response regulator LiaR